MLLKSLRKLGVWSQQKYSFCHNPSEALILRGSRPDGGYLQNRRTRISYSPGHKPFQGVSNFPNCGKEIEIFSDEFDKKHVCRDCHMEVDFGKCSLRASASTDQPR
jgi:hypothetical protein